MLKFLSKKKRRKGLLQNIRRQFRAMIEKLEDRALMAGLTDGNVVVERIGDGATALSGSAAQISVIELTPTGTLVQTLSSQFTGSNLQTDSGTATSNGYLGINGEFLAVAGYDRPLGTASVTSTNFKVGQILDATTGNVATRALFPTGGPSATPQSPFSGNNLRSIVPTGNSTFYVGGTASGTPNTGGVWYYDGTSFVQVSATTSTTNLRNVEIYGSQLYVSTGSGTPGIYAVGTGTPTNTGNALTPIISVSGASPYGFVLFDTDNNGSMDRAYVADDRTSGDGGLQRWDFNGTSWAMSWARRFDPTTGGLNTTATTTIRGLTGEYDSATNTAKLYATTSETTNNRLVTVTDTGSATSGIPTTFTQLAQAGANFVFRGTDIYNATVDTTAPTVTFDDGDADDAVLVNELLTYTLSFSEDIDAATVSTADFNNAGTATINIGAITETSPGTFKVEVTPTTTGSVILRVPTGAVITDIAGNALVVPVQDDTTVTVTTGDSTPPTVVSINDSDVNNIVPTNVELTYTITFSEDIDSTTVAAADFENAGSATISVGTITETTAGVFTVVVTPTSAGSLQLRIAGTIKDVAGNNLVVPVSDDDTLTVDGTAPTVTSITNNSSGSVFVDTPVTFTLVFSEDIDATTVTVADFANAGTSTISIGAITEPNPGEFTVVVTPTSAGTLILRIPSGAVISDLAGNNVAAPVGDDETITVTATTVLSAGDISIIGYRTGTPDSFAFVTWVDISGGTRISFWDHGYIGGGDGTGQGAGGGTWRSNENLAQWVNGATTIPAGTVVVISASATSANGNADIGTMIGQLDGLSAAGDQIFAGQGTFSGSVGSQNFLGTLVFGADFNAGAGWDASATTAQTSGLPSVLNIAGGNISFDTSDAIGNRQYSGARQFTSFALARSAIANTANYSEATTTTLDSGDFSEVPDTDPPTVTIDDGDLDDTVTSGTLLTYTLTFSEPIQVNSFRAADFDNAGTANITIGALVQVSPTVFTVEVTPDLTGSPDITRTLILRIKSSANIRDLAGNAFVVPVTDDTTVAVTSSDFTPPNLVSIDDGDADNLVKVGDVLTYTIEFDEDIDASTFNAADLANNGSAGISIGAINETSPGKFTALVTTTSAGALTLRIVGVITDVAGNPLFVPVNDDTTLTVDGTAPTLSSITDDTTGSASQQGASITFTVTFSEDIDATTVSAADFDNAGTATISVGAINETSAGVFTVVVNPSTAGTLRLRIPSGAVIADLAGNALTVPVLDDTTIDITPVTTLVAGDIVVLGYNTNASPDNFMIMTFVDLLPGTRFFVNDNEIAADGGAAFTDLNEVEASFTVKVGQTIPAGTIISLPWGGTSVSTTTYDWVLPSGAGFANNNEEIYIYTAPTITALTPTAFIYGVSIGTSASARPAGLVAGATFIEPTGGAGRYKTTGAVYAGVPSQLRTAIGDTTGNWESVAPGAVNDWTFQIGPTFTGAVVNGGVAFTNNNQRSQISSLTVSFASPVTLAADAFSLENIGLLAAGSSFIPPGQIIVNPSSGASSSFVITFDAGSGANGTNVNGIIKRAGGPAASLTGNSLADGNYILRIDPAKVSGDGFRLVGDAAFGDVAIDRFFRMYGDNDGDGDVDGTDNSALRLAQSAYNAAFDWDGNGSVTPSADITNFASNRNKKRRVF
jgi:hypothetical protein